MYRIDKTYRDAFLTSIEHQIPSQYVQCLAKEIDNLYNEKSQIQKLYAQIQKREVILADLIQMSDNLAKNQLSIHSNQTQDKAEKQLEELRNFTLIVVESAIKLREELTRNAPLEKRKEDQWKKFPIIFDKQEYLSKICRDYKIILNGELSKLFKFNKGVDPFFLTPSQPMPLIGKPPINNQ